MGVLKWISANPVIVAMSYIVTFLAFILAIVIPIKQKKKKQLSFYYSTTQLVGKSASVVNGLEMTYQGENINQLAVTELKIWNTGNVLIEDSDIYENHKLSVTIIDSPDIQILDAKKLDETADTIMADIHLEESGVRIKFGSFEKKDALTLNIYHTGDSNTKFSLQGKVKEGKIIKSKVDYDDLLEIMDEMIQYNLWPPFDMLHFVIKKYKKRSL